MARKINNKKNSNLKKMKLNNKINFEDFIAPSYEQIQKEIKRKIGIQPVRPTDLEDGNWTEQALKVLGERYLVKDDDLNPVETPEDMVWRVAWKIASSEAMWGSNKKQVMNLARDFYHLMISRKFLPNSPTLMNAGTGNGLQYSGCYVLPVGDSMEEIFDAIKHQAIIHKAGGGTGFSFNRLRPNGSIVKTSSGIASGPISFMRIFDAATNEVKQGGKRRGANMGILRADHPDILEFIHCKEKGGITNFNISVGITDKFMKAYKNNEDYELLDPRTDKVVGTLSAKKVFDEIAEGAHKTGDPGLIFIDKINKSSANPVPSMGPIEATNPCVTGDTLVSTNKGLCRIKDLYINNSKPKLLVDGRLSDVKFQPLSKVVETGKKQIYRLKTKEGYELRLTGDHRVLTKKGWVKAIDLQNGEKIYISNRKGGYGIEGSVEEGKIMGWLVGDGTMKASQAILSFFGEEKQELAPKFATMVSKVVDGMQVLSRDYSVSVIDIKGRGEARVQSVRLARYLNNNGISKGTKLKVPERVFLGKEEMQRGFLQALFTADGHVAGSTEKGVSVRLTSISESLLKDVQRVLINFGIVSKIYTERRKEMKRSLPDGKGGTKKYLCKAYHDLVISKTGLNSFSENIGFLSEVKNLKLDSLLARYIKGPYRQNFYARFTKLIKEKVETVYDLTEPMTSSFVANGLVVHNCGEQPLYPYDACNLGSIFLTYFIKDGKVDWDSLKESTRTAVRFLDNVIEVNPYPLPQIRNTVFGARRIGLGVGGWADMLLSLEIPYDSQEALDLAEKIMKTIQKQAVLETQELAKKRGAFPLFDSSIYKNKKPRRNSTVTTIAPTGTISIIAGSSSGIEPLFAIAYQHIVKDKHLNRKMSFVNPLFESVAKDKGFWSSELMDKVSEHGVVRKLVEIPKKIRKVFGTSHEIDPIWHIKTQSIFQKYTENAVSKTINLRHDVTVDDVKDAYIKAWESECRGITVFRDGCKDTQVLNLGVKNKTAKTEKTQEVTIDEDPLRQRPYVVTGSTYKMGTPVGTAFVTINEDTEGQPLEVFINVGKAGSDVAAMAEALGRTISTSLKFKGGVTAKERAREFAEQLAGIGGRRSIGFGPTRIRSLPDAVAGALSIHYKFEINGYHLSPQIFNGDKVYSNGQTNGVVEPKKEEKVSGDLFVSEETEEKKSDYLQMSTEKPGDICPSCGVSALVFQEGCSKCYACGHSEC